MDPFCARTLSCQCLCRPDQLSSGDPGGTEAHPAALPPMVSAPCGGSRDLERLPEPAGSGALCHPPSRCAEPGVGAGAQATSHGFHIRQLQRWMLAQIPDGAVGLDQLVCVALGLPRSGWQDPAGLDCRDRVRRRRLWPPADCVYIAQATLCSNALGAAIAQATHDTRENHERAVLRELALHHGSGRGLDPGRRTPHAETVFRQLTEQGSDFLLTVKAEPTDPAPPDQRAVSLFPQDPFYGNGFRAHSRARHHLDPQGQTGS